MILLANGAAVDDAFDLFCVERTGVNRIIDTVTVAVHVVGNLKNDRSFWWECLQPNGPVAQFSLFSATVDSDVEVCHFEWLEFEGLRVRNEFPKVVGCREESECQTWCYQGTMIGNGFKVDGESGKW